MKILATLAVLAALTALAQRTSSIPPPCPKGHDCCLDDPNGCGVLDLTQPASAILSHPLRLTGVR